MQKTFNALKYELIAKFEQKMPMPKDFDAAERWFKSKSQTHVVETYVVEDWGSSILGNGIRMVYKGMEKRGGWGPNGEYVFHNRWTQGEQSDALYMLMILYLIEHPQFAKYLHYDHGRMD